MPRRGAEDVAEDRLALDGLVGGQDDHDLVVGPVDHERGQGDRGRRVPPERLDHHADAGRLLEHDVPVAAVGDDRDVVGQAGQPVDGSLQERPFTEQRQEGLRALWAAQRVESGPTATGQDHGVHAALV